MATSKKTATLRRTDGVASTSIAVKPSRNVVSLAEAQKQLANEVAGLAERTQPPGGNAIRITQDKHFELPDGRRSPGPIEMIVVDFVSMNRFYEGAYDSKNITPPACFAIGLNPSTLAPSDNSPDKQSDTCAPCPMNQFGSAANGRGGKACANTRRLAVLAPDAK
jgi:hypothetical protein